MAKYFEHRGRPSSSVDRTPARLGGPDHPVIPADPAYVQRQYYPLEPEVPGARIDEKMRAMAPVLGRPAAVAGPADFPPGYSQAEIAMARDSLGAFDAAPTDPRVRSATANALSPTPSGNLVADIVKHQNQMCQMWTPHLMAPRPPSDPGSRDVPMAGASASSSGFADVPAFTGIATGNTPYQKQIKENLEKRREALAKDNELKMMHLDSLGAVSPVGAALAPQATQSQPLPVLPQAPPAPAAPAGVAAATAISP